jgi:hypothetical protein
VCGLYDVSLSKFGQVANLVTFASNYGKQSKVNDYFGLNFRARVGSGQLGGGLDTGRTVTDRCFVVDSPQELKYCHQTRPLAATTQVKVFGTYPLPGDIAVSGTFQNVPAALSSDRTLGYVEANYPARNAEIAPSLGRNLGQCGAAAMCNATATIPLIEPWTMFSDRHTQVDLRVTKIFRFRNGRKFEASADVYNVLNSSGTYYVNGTYGPDWLKPVSSHTGSAFMDGRMVQFAAKLDF